MARLSSPFLEVMMRRLIAMAGVVVLTGCVTLSADPVQISKIESIAASPREVTIINETPYTAEMTIALANAGIQLKPSPSLGSVTANQNGASTTQRLYTTRYGLDLQVIPTRQICAFTDYRIVNAKATVIDLTNNRPVAVLTQRGPDGPCTTVEPVFGTLGQAISDLWPK